MTRYDAVEVTSYRVAREISLTVLSSWRWSRPLEFAEGRARLVEAAEVASGPVVDRLDLLVLNTVGAV